jgi:hypothetical protein
MGIIETDHLIVPHLFVGHITINSLVPAALPNGVQVEKKRGHISNVEPPNLVLPVGRYDG